ncbi:hypothetical protein BH23BAC3_BH23BAC3_04990 [soil metagenome]
MILISKKQIANILSTTALLLVVQTSDLFSQDPPITGFDGWSVVIDPGHSQTENMGIYGYSEAEKVLEISLLLRDLLEEQTDIAEVYLTRDNHTDMVSLSQRTDFANDVAADFFHSVHSDAGAPSVNTTLFLWGGWLNHQGEIEEKTPNGGKLMGDIMNVDLPHAMRVGTRGPIADRTFYQTGVGNQYPYLFVNRTSNMASVLSEGGFHTNPRQNQLNMNLDYLRLETQSNLWSYLEYLELDRIDVGILSGVITDLESGDPINGAEVTIEGSTYTTDTFESLFYQYSNDPDQLSNGFYYFGDLDPEATYTITIEAVNYYTEEMEASINSQDFTFQDAALLSSAPPVVEILHYDEETGLMPGENLRIEFSRDMDRSSVEDAIEISPEVEYTSSWQNDRVISIQTENFEFESEYILTISDSATDQYDHKLDGDFDGEEGGEYTVTIQTTPEDIDPPIVVSTYPSSGSINFFTDDIVRVTFNEALNEEKLAELNIQVGSSSHPDMDFSVTYTETEYNSVLQLIPHQHFFPAQSYEVSIPAGVEDRFGNATDEEISFSFITANDGSSEIRYIDSFDEGVGDWWEPQQSGSTSGINTEKTSRPHEVDEHLSAKGSSGAMRINYGWDKASNGPYLIRVYRGGGLRFTSDNEMHAYVFGDASNTPMRFVVRDGNNELEASNWINVDWTGWKLVRWEMTNETANAWVNGNGNLDGDLYIDSIQLSYAEGESDIEGSIIVDELRVVKTGTPVSIEEELSDARPTSVELEQNYPNPFNPSTVINYSLPEATSVSLNVYNLTGQQVAIVDEGQRSAGSHTVNFDAGHLSSGVYIYRLTAGNTVETRKMTLIK